MSAAQLNLSRRPRLPVMTSTEAAECGLACLAMVARYHGQDVDLNGLRQRHPLSSAGISLRALMDLAHGVGLSSRALRVELEDLAHLPTPAILHWNLNHFVVLKDVRGDKVKIHDPAAGARTLPLSEASRHFTGVALEITPRADAAFVSARAGMRLSNLFSGLSGHRAALAQVLALSAALQIVAFASPFQLQLVIDEAVMRGDEDLLFVLAAGFAGLAVLHAVIEALRGWTLKVFGFQASFQLVGNLVSHLIRLPSAWFEKRHIGDIMSRLGSANTIQDTLTRGVVEAVLDGVMALGAGIILFAYSPLLAGVVLGSIALVLVINLLAYPAMKARMEQRLVASAKEQSHLMETVRASTIVKVMGHEAQREGEWRNLYAEVLNGWASIGKYEIGASFVRSTAAGLQTVAVVVLGAHMIMEVQGFSIGMLFAFLAFRQMFTDRAMGLVDKGVQFRLLTMHLGRLADVVHAEPEPTLAAATAEIRGGLKLEGVSFRYGTGDRFVLKDVELTIEPGEFVAVVGQSGSGKTTLLKLLLGLHTPTEGHVSLDGLTATPALWRSWRARVGLVSQDDRLLSGTIADNIAFFDPDLSMTDVVEAAEAARIHHDILQMPMQYLSLVGDMGSALSGGQKQRLLLARALYRRPRILILDEGTANLDAETEDQIVDFVAALSVTRIVVAHRPALINRADRVLVIGDGGLVEHPRKRSAVA